MTQTKYPIFDISDIFTSVLDNSILSIDRFNAYLHANPHLQVIHSHNFYHLVYFTKGRGSQVIDFTRFPVEPGIIYFMNPIQVHQWQFETEVDGYIVNFSPTYFEQLEINSKLLHQFPFFNCEPDFQVIHLSKPSQKKVAAIFEKLLVEQQKKNIGTSLMIAAELIQLFITVQRDASLKRKCKRYSHPHTVTLRKFTRLIESHFAEKKLPNEYAAMLFITPKQLNLICKEILGLSAGEVIRRRILLEAKRLLVNFDLSIDGIAEMLSFNDSSYFVKFFRKYTGETPEKFRAGHYGN